MGSEGVTEALQSCWQFLSEFYQSYRETQTSLHVKPFNLSLHFYNHTNKTFTIFPLLYSMNNTTFNSLMHMDYK